MPGRRTSGPTSRWVGQGAQTSFMDGLTPAHHCLASEKALIPEALLSLSYLIQSLCMDEWVKFLPVDICLPFCLLTLFLINPRERPLWAQG